MAAASGDMADGDLLSERKRDRMRRYARRAVRVPLSVRTGDLPKRAASAAVMLAVAGVALWVGGWLLATLVAAVAFATYWEFARLAFRATRRSGARTLALVLGALYIGSAGYFLLELPLSWIIVSVALVIAVDTFAYFFGRGLGGPKIAPRISPSKTWAGLLGGSIGASIVLAVWLGLLEAGGTATILLLALFWGVLIAVTAQAGDFLESWMKRKAGVKDSSNLIPGHGGVFDRTDGLIPVILLTSGVYWSTFG